MVFKQYSRWLETRVCCPKTLCSGHLENEGLRSESKGVSTSSLPSLPRVHIGSQAIFRIFWLFEFLLKGICHIQAAEGQHASSALASVILKVA